VMSNKNATKTASKNIHPIVIKAIFLTKQQRKVSIA
jgi:hypothetical protein